MPYVSKGGGPTVRLLKLTLKMKIQMAMASQKRSGQKLRVQNTHVSHVCVEDVLCANGQDWNALVHTFQVRKCMFKSMFATYGACLLSSSWRSPAWVVLNLGGSRVAG